MSRTYLGTVANLHIPPASGVVGMLLKEVGTCQGSPLSALLV